MSNETLKLAREWASKQFWAMNLKMEWVTPTHLNVTYGASSRPRDHVSLDFQVVKIGGQPSSAWNNDPKMY